MIPFTKRKFLKLEDKLKHRKCAELLREIYLFLQEKNTIPEETISLYETYLSWMKFLPFKAYDLKSIADQYHLHLKLASISLKEHNLLPHIRKGDHTPKADFLPIAIYLDHTRSAYNVGSILRTMEALRIGSLYTSAKTPASDHPKVEHTSMGASKIVPSHSNALLENLPRPWIALETSDDAIPVSDFLFPSSFTLILGNEEYGVSDETLAKVDLLIEIPLLGMKNSINVASAFSIAAHEIRKQRNPSEISSNEKGHKLNGSLQL